MPKHQPEYPLAERCASKVAGFPMPPLLNYADASCAKADAWHLANLWPLFVYRPSPAGTSRRTKLCRISAAADPGRGPERLADGRSDLAAGLLFGQDDPWNWIVADAEVMAVAHTPAIGCRTLDMLHVAAAGMTIASEFFTFNPKQADLARALGMKVILP